MKCSVVGCPNLAIFHDEVSEAAKKMGIKGAKFCHEHQDGCNKFGKLSILIAEKKKNAQKRSYDQY